MKLNNTLVTQKTQAWYWSVIVWHSCFFLVLVKNLFSITYSDILFLGHSECTRWNSSRYCLWSSVKILKTNFAEIFLLSRSSVKTFLFFCSSAITYVLRHQMSYLCHIFASLMRFRIPSSSIIFHAFLFMLFKHCCLTICCY